MHKGGCKAGRGGHRASALRASWDHLKFDDGAHKRSSLLSAPPFGARQGAIRGQPAIPKVPESRQECLSVMGATGDGFWRWAEWVGQSGLGWASLVLRFFVHRLPPPRQTVLINILQGKRGTEAKGGDSGQGRGLCALRPNHSPSLLTFLPRPKKTAKDGEGGASGLPERETEGKPQ